MIDKKTYAREYYHKNKKKIKIYKKIYYQENKEKFKDNEKEYYKKNKEKILTRQKEYYKKNKEEIKAYRSTEEYRERRKDKRNNDEYREHQKKYKRKYRKNGHYLKRQKLNYKRGRSYIDSIRKQSECKICGFDDWRALVFHHRNPEEKEYLISAMCYYPNETIQKEMNKCDILCANCHRILHHESNLDK